MMQLPGMLDWFGWCTWDAFYQEVHPRGIKDGLKRLVQFLIHFLFIFRDLQWYAKQSSLLQVLSLYVCQDCSLT